MVAWLKRLFFRMSAKRTRLIAWAALVVFLTADGMAIAHPCLPFPRCGEEASCECAEAALPCEHCHTGQMHADAFGDCQEATGKVHSTCPCPDDDCPNPSCPSPGGC